MSAAGSIGLGIRPFPREGDGGPSSVRGQVRKQGKAASDPETSAFTAGALAGGYAAAGSMALTVRSHGLDSEDGPGEAVTRGGNGKKAVRVALAVHLPELGEVQVALTALGGRLEADIVAAGPEQEAFLQSRLPELEWSLSEMYQLASIRVRSKVDIQR